jgi:hypothetical protein
MANINSEGIEYEWEANELALIRSKYKAILEDSSYLLNYAVYQDTVNNCLQIIIVILGLIAGFVSAISGIDASVKTYIGSVFSLLSSLLAGVMSIKKFGTNSGRYYGAYQEYKELATYMNNLLITLKADQKYEQLNILIARKEAKYEIMFPKNKISLEKITVACAALSTLTESNLASRTAERANKVKKEELDKQDRHCRQFMDRKAYIFLHEIKLQLYKTYVEQARARDTREVILDFENYENYFRVKHVEQFQAITEKYNEYQRRQLCAYYTAEEVYHHTKIEEEIGSSPLLRMPDNVFYQKVLHRFHEHTKTIKENPTDTEIYAFDNII